MTPTPEASGFDSPNPERWPNQTDYQDALLNPASCFVHPALRRAEPADWMPFGLPRPIAGQFANVYRLKLATGGYVAVRLFLTPQPARERRYAAFESFLQRLGANAPTSLVRFQYQNAGLLVGGVTRPLLLMDWVDGVPLAEFVEKHLHETGRIRALAEQWRELIANLNDIGIAHGDLQHGNILVETGVTDADDRLRLIDYDGVWVPALHGSEGLEIGHPAYRHRDRTIDNFGPEIDRLPAQVIYTSLRVLAVAPEVWYRLHDGDNLIFRQEDLVDPDTGRAFSTLNGSVFRDQETVRLVRDLRLAATVPYVKGPSFP